MRNFLNVLENSILGFNVVLGLSLTLDDVYALLGIIMLILQILVILTKAGFKIYEKIKAKKYEEISGVVEETVQELEELKEGKKENEKN